MGTPQEPADLHSHRWLNFRLPGGRVLPWEFKRNGEVREMSEIGPLASNDADLLIAAAVEGCGILCITEATIPTLLATGRLVPVLKNWSEPYPGWHLYYPRGASAGPCPATLARPSEPSCGFYARRIDMRMRPVRSASGRRLAAQLSRHSQPVPHVEAEQRDVGCARQQFERLDHVEPRVERPGLRFERQVEGGGNEDEQTVGGDEGHAFLLPLDQRTPPSLAQKGAAEADGNQCGDQDQQAPGHQRLDGDHDGFTAENFAESGRKPEGQDREQGNRTCNGM